MISRFYLILIALLTLADFSCKTQSQQAPPSPPPPAVERPKIVAFGDSLTAGLGLTAAETYPAQLQKLLDAAGYQYEVVNAGVSGETTAGGLRRMDWTLDGDVRFVILELGANDILRGQPVDLLKENLTKMIDAIQRKGATVILAGMEAPTNSGPEYRLEVHNAYKDVAEQYKLPFIPFLLKGVAGVESLNQEDLSHPNAEGARIVAQNVLVVLKPLLDRNTRSQPAK